MMGRNVVAGLLCTAFLVFGCFASALPANLTIYTVKPAAAVQSYLFFQGNIAPLHQRQVLSPIAGIVSQAPNFNYGDKVTKGQYLFALKPNDRQNSYRTALLAYLRAKSSYSQAMAKYTGQELLYNNKILARNDFLQVKNNLSDQKLALEEALFNLKTILEKISNNSQVEQNLLKSLSSLSLNDQHVYAALNRSFDEVKVEAPASGVALLPPKQGGDSDSQPLQTDSVVKLEQVLLTVGDFSGLKVGVDVSEVSINKLHPGQTAEVTGPAFPGITLAGKVATISYQAKSGGYSGSLPQFPITITVPKLTAAQQKLIHAGMTAQVKISLNNGAQIQVPLAAVSTALGKTTVQKVVQGKLVVTPVVTGNTTLKLVTIVKGVTAGDKIALPH